MKILNETRNAYGEALVEIGKKNPKIVVLDSDLYRSTRTVKFKETFPERFFDIGISESDMVSTAAGLAAEGFIPFCNSFAIFLPGICYIPIRTQIAYPSLPVKLIGSSAGLTEGPDGASHQALEDIALMRSLPNMVVVSPADDIEALQATKVIADFPGPVYMRLGRYPVPRITDSAPGFEIGKARILRQGGDVAIFATGHMVSKALEAAEILVREQIEASIVNVSTIKPLDIATVVTLAESVALTISVEEHNIIGGLGSAIAECLSATPYTAPLLRLGVRDCFGESGLADELLEKHRLTGKLIAEDIKLTFSKIKEIRSREVTPVIL